MNYFLIAAARNVEKEWAEFTDDEGEYYRKDFPQDGSKLFYEFRDAIYVSRFRCSGGEYAWPEEKIAKEGHERPELDLEF